MPTANRRRFVPEAIRLFLAQDYPEKELVILDDGEDSVVDTIPDNPQIRYLRNSRRQPVGTKRNLACEMARGEIIAHWDDDDWYAPWRLSYQVEELIGSGAEICGLDRVFFFDDAGQRAWEYVYPQGGARWVCGATLCYRKTFWQRNRFPEINVGEDTRFVFSAPSTSIKVLERIGFFVSRIHAANTSRKQTRDPRWLPAYPATVLALMDDKWVAPAGCNGPIPRKGATADGRIEEGRALKLNLGCCDAPLPGFVNVDIVAAAGVDAVVDLRNPWPWPDDSVEHVRAWDIIEHLPDKILTMNEIWRVLGAGGTAEIVIPTTDGSGAFQDPTHVSYWNRRSFLYYETGNPYRERFAQRYGIRAKFRIISERMDATVDGPRLTIVLSAAKP